MDWSTEPKARLLVTAYVVGFLLWLAGLIVVLYNQATSGSGASMTVGVVLFAVGQAVITSLAFRLRTHFPAPNQTQGNFQRAWNHLALGLALPSAVRLLLNR
ncbi:hypothetical protein [Kribbella catacumbae]|uniref:hypothetical protein n=1 Tax=Kribbella catacumbae TaxID=460086 RepID=UPI0003749E6B|nr:hypothetical protein [Kribbella catacumbae]